MKDLSKILQAATCFKCKVKQHSERWVLCNVLSDDVLCLGGDLETISGGFSPKKRVQIGMDPCYVYCAFPNKPAGSCSDPASGGAGASKCTVELQLQPARCILLPGGCQSPYCFNIFSCAPQLVSV